MYVTVCCLALLREQSIWPTCSKFHPSLAPSPDTVAFRIYDIDCDGFISNGELFQVWELCGYFTIVMC